MSSPALTVTDWLIVAALVWAPWIALLAIAELGRRSDRKRRSRRGGML